MLLLEESERLGGACRGVVQDGHGYDVGVSLITGAAPGGAVAALCGRLGINVATMPCDPTVQVALPRHRLSLAPGNDGWWPEIHREFPEEEEGWHALVTDMVALARDRDELARRLPPLPPLAWRDRLRCWRILARRSLGRATRQATRQLRRAAGTPFRATLADHGLGAASRQALDACLWYLLLRGIDECSTLEAALAIAALRDGAVALPQGPASLADGLAQYIRERGGEIRLRTPVGRCVVERGRVTGITTKAGETIRARWVVTDVPPSVLADEVLPVSRRSGTARGPWRARYVAQCLGVAVPQAFVPSELGWHCIVVGDGARPAREDNAVFIHRTAAQGLAHLTVGRFVSPSAPGDERAVAQALTRAADCVIPGVADVAVHRRLVPSAVLGEAWGRPMAAVRYEVDSREWLGRRGMAHHLGWRGLLAVGEWTYPGRLVSDVVEGAMHVADVIAAERK